MKIASRIDSILNVPIDLIVKHLEKRQFETAMSCIMIGTGLMMMMSPKSIEISSMRYLLQYVSSTFIVVVFLTFGIARIVALALNGSWMPYGAYLRAAGAVVGAMMWGQWCASFFQLHQATGAPLSLGAMPFAVLAVVETLSFYRALDGAKHGEADRLDLEAGRVLAGRSNAQPAGVRGDRVAAVRVGPEGHQIRSAVRATKAG